MSKFSRMTFGVLSLALLGVIPAVASDKYENVDWETASPVLIHQRMGEEKARGLENFREASRLMPSGALAAYQMNYDMKFYDINIRINDTTQILYGKIGFTATATENNVTQIAVDFFSNMTLDSIPSPAGLLSYVRVGNVVTITLDHNYSQDEQMQFTIFYHGHPIEGGFQAFAFDTRLGFKVMTSLSEPYYARTWWPCKDRMDDKADSFNIAIEVDTLYYVGSNGTLDSIGATTPNSHTFYYRVRYPMATYLFSVAASKYSVWTDLYVYNGGLDTMPVVNAVYPDRLAYGQPRWGIAPSAIGYLSQTFGPYPFLNEKYGHANFEWGGGMEHQTMTSMGGDNFGFSEPVVVHELTHQWWGDMITCNNWGHIWLNEGFASYGEAVYYLNKSGYPTYHSYMNSMAFLSGGSIYINDTSSVNNIFGSIVYDKGAWVLHMLRHVVGEAGFNAAMAAWASSPYKYKSATTEQFRDVVEGATGMDLDLFFQQWIYGTFYPKFSYAWMSEPVSGGGSTVYVIMRQTQTTNPQVFNMPIDLLVDYPSFPDDSMKTSMDSRRRLTKFHVPTTPMNVLLDVNNWILKTATQTAWPLTIVTLDSDLTVGHKNLLYTDTVQRRGGATVTFSKLSGTLPTGYALSSAGIITGTTSDTGTFTFTVRVVDNASAADTATLKLTVNELLLPGDVNFGGTVDISDLTMLIDYLYITPGVILPKPNLADCNGSCAIDISDLLALIDHLYITFAPLQMGCVQ